MLEIELLHTTCAITSITKLTQSVMPRSHEGILFSGPLRPSLYTTPRFCVCLYLTLRCYGCQCLEHALCQVELTNETYNDLNSTGQFNVTGRR